MLLSRKQVHQHHPPSFLKLWKPLKAILSKVSPLHTKGNRPLKMDVEHQLKALIFFHLEEHSSASHLLQVLQEDAVAAEYIAPPDGIEKSRFSEANNTRGLEPFLQVLQALYAQANQTLPKDYAELGDLVSIDGSLIDAVLSMHWADYREGTKKAKAHMGFDINRSIPKKIFLTDGHGPERPFVSQILDSGQTGIMDRGYPCHQTFDVLQSEAKHFVCRIKSNTTKVEITRHVVTPHTIVFSDAVVLLGTPGVSQTEQAVRLVGYHADENTYWVATDRHDLTAEQVALVYKLRWDIENFFVWWKRHLQVYHLIARSEHGFMIQLLSGLITYLLLAIYCQEEHGETVTIRRVRKLRTRIHNEPRQGEPPDLQNMEDRDALPSYASP